MKNRYPRKTQHEFTNMVREKAKELLGDKLYDSCCNFNQFRIFMTDSARGRASYDLKTVVIPLWCFKTPEKAIQIMKLDYTGKLINQYWVYYLAHELSHMVAFLLHGEKNHGAQFMTKFIDICPVELQFFELGYKPRNAKAAGISL